MQSNFYSDFMIFIFVLFLLYSLSFIGEVRFNQVYCKKSKQWMLKKIFTAHTTNFVGELIERVLEYRRNVNIKYKTPTSSLAVPQPDLPPNIASLPKPAKALFKSRF